MSTFETSPLTVAELKTIHAAQAYDWGEALTIMGNAVNGLKDSVPLGKTEQTLAHLKALKEATAALQLYLNARGVS